MRNEDTGHKGDAMPDTTDRPVLSISLLCSGRNIDETQKCLDSLMTISNQVSSEIIIVDTGCGKEARSLIEKYADLIVSFEWCDDFAKARNAGLEKCTGEWFLFVDDDEWFENTDAIVDFFNSGEYRDYFRAEYIIRNYTKVDGSLYADTWCVRLVKMLDGLRFVGKVHEYLTPMGEKLKHLNSLAHHYGYAYVDTEALFKKAQRNIPLLLDMIKEDPYNGHYRSQLIQEYRNIKNYSEMEKLCLSSLDMIKDVDNPRANIVRPNFYEGVMISELNTYEYDRAVSHLNEYIGDKRNSEKCEIGLCYYAVQAYWGKKDYQHTFVYAQRYLDGYDKFSQEEDVSIDDLTFMCGNIFDKVKVQYVVSRVVDSGVRCGSISALHDYFNRFDMDSHLEPIIQFCEGVSYAFENFDFDERFVAYADEMCRYTYLLALLIKEAANVEKKSQRKFKRLLNVYGRTDNADDIYMIYMHILYDNDHNDMSKLEDAYRVMLDRVPDFMNVNTSIWQIANERNINIALMFKEMPYLQWKNGVDILFGDSNEDDFLKRVSAVSEIIIDSGDDIRFRYFRLKQQEYITSKADGESAELSLKDYCTSCVNFYLEIYRAELFTDDTTVLPDECRFAMEFVKALNSETQSTPTEYIHKLERCAGIYPVFAETMKKYIENYGTQKSAELAGRLQNGV